MGIGDVHVRTDCLTDAMTNQWPFLNPDFATTEAALDRSMLRHGVSSSSGVSKTVSAAPPVPEEPTEQSMFAAPSRSISSDPVVSLNAIPRSAAIIKPVSCSSTSSKTGYHVPTQTERTTDALLIAEASQRAEYLERNYVASEVKSILNEVLASGRRPIDPADISHLRRRWSGLQHHEEALTQYWDTLGSQVNAALTGAMHSKVVRNYQAEVQALTAKIASAYQLGLNLNDAWEQWSYPDQVPVDRRARFFEPSEGRPYFHPTSARYFSEPTIAELMDGRRKCLFHHSIDLFIFRTTYQHISGQRFCTYSVYSDYDWRRQYSTGRHPKITEGFDAAEEFVSLDDALDFLRDALFFGNFSYPAL